MPICKKYHDKNSDCSTTCLFTAQVVIQESMQTLLSNDGLLTAENTKCADLKSCQTLLEENFMNRSSVTEIRHG